MLKILDLKTNHRSEPLGIDGVPYSTMSDAKVKMAAT